MPTAMMMAGAEMSMTTGRGRDVNDDSGDDEDDAYKSGCSSYDGDSDGGNGISDGNHDRNSGGEGDVMNGESSNLANKYHEVEAWNCVDLA